MNPEQILAYLMQQAGNGFQGAWNAANQAALPPLRGAANILARPLGYGVGASMGLNNNQMNEQYYKDISNGLISDKNPLADAASLALPDVQGAVSGDPYAIAGLIPYVGRVARPVKTIGKGVKEGQQITKMIKPAIKSAKPAAKGVKPAKTTVGKVAQHVDRNAGKYYGGTIAADLVNSMYGGN
jgi:hypothetical protein